MRSAWRGFDWNLVRELSLSSMKNWLLSIGTVIVFSSDPSLAVVNGQSLGRLYEEASKHVVALQIRYQKEDGSIGFKKATGVLLAKNILLTAGHNVHRKEIIDVEAIFSQHPCWGKNSCAETRALVVKNIVHPKYDDPGERDVLGPPVNDLALLKIAVDAPGAYSAVDLPPHGPMESSGMLGGFGMSKDLQFETPLSDFRLRARELYLLPDFKLGANSQFSLDQSQGGGCAGDSGAPAFFEDKAKFYLAGIFSRVGVDPDSNRMSCFSEGFYSDVVHYKDWIKHAWNKLESEK